MLVIRNIGPFFTRSSSYFESSSRAFSSASSIGRESLMKSLLVDKLKATKVELKDTSGGCGEFYQLYVESPLFFAKPMLAQHRLVTECLSNHIGKMHGLTITTKAVTLS